MVQGLYANGAFLYVGAYSLGAAAITFIRGLHASDFSTFIRTAQHMKRLIEKILSLGTDKPGLSAYERHSVRLINAICFFLIVAKVIEDILTFRVYDLKLIVHSLITHAFLLLVLFFHCKRRLLAGKITFTAILLAVLLSIPFAVPHSMNAEGIYLVIIVVLFSIYDRWVVLIPLTAFIISIVLLWHFANHAGLLQPMASIAPDKVHYVQVVYSLTMAAILVIALISSREINAAYRRELNRNIEEKDALIKEVHHRVKNNLQIIISMLGIQESGGYSSEALEIIKDVKARVMTMSLIHNRLYSTRDFQYVDVSEYITELTHLLIDMFNGRKASISHRVAIEPLQMGLAFSIPLGLIVTEVISNSIKHALIPGRPAKIDIKGAVKNGYFVLELSDNGNGIDSSVEKSESLGFLLIDILCKQIQAKLSRTNNNGLLTTITCRI